MRLRHLVMTSIASVIAFAMSMPVFGAIAVPPRPVSEVKLRLKVGEFDPLVSAPALPERLRLTEQPASGIFVVQFRRPIDPGLLQKLRTTGAETLKYLPDNAYIVRLPPAAAEVVRSLAEVRWLGPVEPGFKLSPDLGLRPRKDPSSREGGVLRASADLFPGEDAEHLAAQARGSGADVFQIARLGGTARLYLRATIEQLEVVARLPGVVWIEEMGEATLRNDTTRWVIQTNAPGSTTVWDHGLHGEGQIIGHIDMFLDINSCYFKDPIHFTAGPDHRKVVAYRSKAGMGVSVHGTHTAGTAAGDQFPINGSTAQNGNAYAARLYYANLNDITGFGGTQISNLYRSLGFAHSGGGRVHTNSWGDDGTTAYTTWCADIDEFSYDYEESLVVFAATNGSALRTPENAKNCLAVGASQNGANDESFCSGGQGPTGDGRRKPEIFAPGCGIVSALSNVPCSITTQTGTSMAAPAIAAAATLARQYFVEGFYPSGVGTPADALTPSGALLKATLLNSAADMTGISGYPGYQEGWGRVLLENALYFSGDTRRLSVLADVRNGGGLRTGESGQYPLVVNGSSETLRLTLVWTEPPAALLASSASVNDLDLEVVSPSGTLYLGNAFDTFAGRSVSGGSKDSVNNVEMVLVPAPEAGMWTVRVKGGAVNEGTQGYALVASGQVTPSRPVALAHEDHEVQDPAPGGNGDGVIDPGETISMPVTLRNVGSIPLSGVSVTLSSDRPDLVQITRATASFPDLIQDATGTSQPPQFLYTVSPAAACGSVVHFRTDVAASQGGSAASFAVEIGNSRVDSSGAGLPVTIPANSATGVSSAATVAQSFTVGDAKVFVDIVHQDVGQLLVTLTSPQSTSVTLHNYSHDSTKDILAVYGLDRQPDGPGALGDLAGEQASGVWTLSVADTVGGPIAAGTLRGFTLELKSVSPLSCSPLTCPDPVPAEIPPGLTLAKENGVDLRLTWPVVSGVASYRVWRSPTPDFAQEALTGTTTAATFLETGALATATTAYYEVRAVNSCEWEGP